MNARVADMALVGDDRHVRHEGEHREPENLVLHSEVVAAVPHFLGVHPQRSLVVVPEVTGDAPVARVNLPHGVTQTVAVAEGLARAYAGVGVGVALLANTDQPEVARQVCDMVRARLEPMIPVIGAVMAGVRAAWEAAHGPGSVIGLAPSTAAAEVLADAVGVPTQNTAKWITDACPNCAGRSTRLPLGWLVPIPPQPPANCRSKRQPAEQHTPSSACGRDSWSSSTRRPWPPRWTWTTS